MQYRPDIDGLRAIAVASVVAYHISPGWIKGGFVGVDVFFVISGFLIGSLVYKEVRDQTFSFARFYTRRSKRILPALFVTLAFCDVVALLLLSPHEVKTFSVEAVAAIMSSANVLYALYTPGYFHPNADLKPLLMSWSLGVEEQFYVVLPILMLWLSKVRVRHQLAIIGAVAFISLAASIWGSFRYPILTYFMFPARAWELAAGVLLAICEINQPDAVFPFSTAMQHSMSIMGLGFIGLSVAVFDDKTTFPGYAALLPVVGAVLIIASRRGVANRFLSWLPIVFVGTVSYSWYLWHWPILTFARIACPRGISISVSSCLGLVSFGCAVLSWKLVEQPFRKSTTATGTLLKRYGLLALVMILPAAGLYATTSYTNNRVLQRLDNASNNLLMDKCAVDFSVAHPPLWAPCVPVGDGRAVALIGDSHATALAGAFRPLAEEQGYRMVELAKGMCPALAWSSVVAVSQLGMSPECLQFNRDTLAFIVRDSSIRVVVIAQYWSLYLSLIASHDHDGRDGYLKKKDLMAQGLSGIISRLEGAGKTVYLVQDGPTLPFDPVRLLRTQLIRPRRALANALGSDSQSDPRYFLPAADPSSSKDQEARAMVSGVVAIHPSTRVIDLRDRLCHPSGCTITDNDQTLYIDDNHLSLLGATLALAGLRLP